MTTTNPVAVWDFTLSVEKCDFETLKEWLTINCKKWAFQKEQGENTGYIHWQGRVSMRKKTRNMKGILKPTEWSPTTNENMDNDFYVLKEQTRIEGPWTDKDKINYIPRQIREIKELYPWQTKIVEMSKKWDTRTINIIYCPNGNQGKSSLVTYMGVYNLGRRIPFANDYKDILRMVCDMPISRSYLIDMPRAINKDKLNQLYSAIETLKDGYAYDDRYHFKEVYFDCPNIFVFTNKLPDMDLLSTDRWKIWHLQNGDLIGANAVTLNIKSPEHLEQSESECECGCVETPIDENHLFMTKQRLAANRLKMALEGEI